MYAPILNPFRFYSPSSDGELDKYSMSQFVALRPYMDSGGYCHKLIEGDRVKVQIHNDTTPVVELKDETGAVISTLTVTELVSGVEGASGIVYNIYEVTIIFSVEGHYYVDVNSGSLLSEMIEVNNSIENITSLIKFSNYQNTLDNYFAIGFECIMRVESQAWRRKPTSDRSFFRSTRNTNFVLAQINNRNVQVDFFDLPYFMHEILAYGFSLSQIILDGDKYIAEEDYSVEYLPRFTNANSSILLRVDAGYAIESQIEISEGILTEDGQQLETEGGQYFTLE